MGVCTCGAVGNGLRNVVIPDRVEIGLLAIKGHGNIVAAASKVFAVQRLANVASKLYILSVQRCSIGRGGVEKMGRLTWMTSFAAISLSSRLSSLCTRCVVFYF